MDGALDDRGELIRSLLLEAGRLMEDASPQFAIGMHDEDAISSRIELLERIGGDLQAIAAASRVLMRGLSTAAL